MTARSAFLLRHLAPVLPAVAILLVLETTTLDSTISGWFFDPVAGVFPLRYSHALEVVGHQWARKAVVGVGCLIFALWLLSCALPELRPHRRLLLFLSLAMAFAPLTVAVLKATSVRHCPWSLQEYGSFAPHLSLFASPPRGSPPGHCFPGGHASAGYCLLAFYFAGYALGNRRLAAAGLWGGLTAGTAFGMARVAQGAHFLSHNLWSALVCWLVMVGIYVLVVGERQVVRPTLAAGRPGTGVREAGRTA
jgi:membrane-associated PAP2 superfamily phosphatase